MRRDQLAKLELALRLLREAGCARVFVGGSFVTDTSEPNDVDVAWDIDGVTSRSFVQFFQYARDDEPVGIVAVDLRTIA